MNPKLSSTSVFRLTCFERCKSGRRIGRRSGVP